MLLYLPVLNAQITLTVSGTTYEVTGDEMLTIANSYAQGARSCAPTLCSPIVSSARYFNLRGNYAYTLWLRDGRRVYSRYNIAAGTQFCPEGEQCFFEYLVRESRTTTISGVSTTTLHGDVYRADTIEQEVGTFLPGPQFNNTVYRYEILSRDRICY